MIVIEKPSFKKVTKKLKKNQRHDLEIAVKEIIANIEIGMQKKGDLAGVRVYKFKMVGQLMLLAYTYEDDTITLTLLGLGSHENFYRDLKR